MDLFISDGATAEYVSTATNATGEMTPILTSDLDAGTWVRLLNRVPKGDSAGIPLYFKLRDSGGNLFPVNSELQLEVKAAGKTRAFKVSKQVASIAQWNQNSISDQRNTDNVDDHKVLLTEPEVLGGQPVKRVDYRDIDQFRVSVRSPSQIDWSQSEFYIDSAAIKGPYQRDGR